eukprot:2567430-Prorocentrum_lima.AAC.1
MTSSLVGSEMCIRDSLCTACRTSSLTCIGATAHSGNVRPRSWSTSPLSSCLLYTSDAADDM